MNPSISDALTRPFTPAQIFAPASTQARSIFELSIFVLIIAAAIFVVVFGLVKYVAVNYRRKRATTVASPCRSTEARRSSWPGPSHP